MKLLTLNKIQQQKNEDRAIILKCIFVVGVIILALIICVNADIGDLGRVLLMICSVIIGCLIMLMKK